MSAGDGAFSPLAPAFVHGNRSGRRVTLRAPFVTVLRRARWRLVVFEATMDLSTLVVLDPLRVLLLERTVALGEDPFVGNAALISFAFSPPGIVALTVAATGSILVGVFAFGGVSMILWDARRQVASSHLVVWRTLISRLPALLAISVCAFGAMLLLISPVLATGLAARRWWLSGGDIYFYLSTRPPQFFWATATIGVVAAVAAFSGLYILLRASLVVPACLLRSVGPAQALRLSAHATSGRTRALMSKLVWMGVCLAIVWAIALVTLSGLLHWLSSRPMSDASLHRIGIAFAILAAVILAALAAISRAAFVLVLLADRAADEALPTRAEPGRVPGRFPKLGVAVTVVLGAAMLAVAITETATTAGAQMADRRVAITAHRAGSARAPENTMAALENAILEGADVVEIDVQETADGEIVVLHDTDLRRVAGVARFVWQMRLAELQQLDVGSWFAPRFRAQRIPTLRAFASASRGRVRLNVELKDNGHGEDLASRVVAILRETGVASDAAVSSLDFALLRQVRRTAPEIKIGLIVATGLGNLRGLDIDFVALARRLATPGVISQLAASQREVHVWTLDDEAAVTRAMLDGADNIITGDPLVAVSVRERLGGLSEPEKVMLRARYSLDAGWLRAIGRTGWTSRKDEATGSDGDAGE